MLKTPKSLRLHIGIFGRTNVGKSSFLNMAAGQDVAITSPVPGTTTDVVEKTMELLPIGPVVFLDTAGLDDISALGHLRIKKSKRVFGRTDVVILIVEPDRWSEYEDKVVEEARRRSIPLLIIINKTDISAPSENFISQMKEKTEGVFLVSSSSIKNRDEYLHAFKRHLIKIVPEDFIKPPPIVGDLIPKGGLAIFIVPIDLEAPKGRIILPQVQAIRDVLDHDQAVLVVKEHQYKDTLKKLKAPPDIVVCDSQVVKKMVEDTPKNIKCTTFSILFARFKGGLDEMIKGVKAIDSLTPLDRVLVAEACSHHAIEDDIGRVKLPKWLKSYVGGELKIDTVAGKDYPEDLEKYKLIIHCGGCMINTREVLTRIERAKEKNIPITNYGLAIAHIHGYLERVTELFAK